MTVEKLMNIILVIALVLIVLGLVLGRFMKK